MNVAGASRERTGSSSSSVASQGSNNSPKHGTISPKTAASNGMMAGSSHGTSAQLGTIERVAFDGNIRKFLENHVLFQNLDESFIMQLNNAMQSRVCSPSEYVIRKGEVGRAMFFILRGEVEVVSEDGETILNVMKEQSFFGEIGVLFSVPRTASCRARGRCIILALTKEKLQRVMEGYPKVAEAIAMIAEERFALHMKQQDSAMKVEFGKELKLGITNKDLKSIPLFRDCEIGFLHMLALSLRPVQFKMGEVIIQKGDIASEMYFVVDGEAEVFSDEDGKVFANFHPGFFFGEVGLFFKIKRTASVRCTSQNITVFKLTKNDLDSVLAGYPEIDAKIKVEAKQRFEYNKMREMAKLTGKQEVETDIEVVREKLKTIPLFKGGSIGFFHELALTLKIRVFQPGDLIIQKDQPGRSMYFVVDGTADVISPDGKEVYGTMLANTFFGEVALFFDVNRTASVRARTVCTLFELEKDSLKKILSQHKQLKEQMYEKAEENFRLWQARQNALKQLGSSKDIQQFDVEATVSRLRMVSMFSKCPDNFLRGLATQTSVHSFGKEDIIVRNGDASTDMFFIVSGGVEIISDDGKQIYDSVAEGGFFGEVGLILNVNRTASVRCATKTCHLIILSASALEKVLEEYPESYQLISLEADKRHQLALTRKLAEKHTNLVIHAKAQRGPNEGEEDSGIAAAATAAALSPRSSDFDKSKTLGRSSGSSSSGNNDAAKSGTVVKDRKRRGSLSMSDKNEGLKTSIGNLFKRKSSKTGGEIHDHDSDDSIELSSEAVSRDSVADGALLRRNSSAFDKVRLFTALFLCFCYR
ncbi:cyclic nucleotide-binding-like protein [Chytridium lagenaria]|nr:cyclic nucleotide-binding-like protein [Chytridium lagenaria]